MAGCNREAAPCRMLQTDVRNRPEINCFDGGSTESFSIRDYVSIVRSSDIRKNWPFSHRYLQICLDNGREALLPPFENPCSLRDPIQKKAKLEAAVHGSDSQGNHVRFGDITENLSRRKAGDSKLWGNNFVVQEDAQKKESGCTNNEEIIDEKSKQYLSVILGGQNGDATYRENVNLDGKGNGYDSIKTKTEALEEFKGPMCEDSHRSKLIAGKLKDSQMANPIRGTREDENRELRTPCKTESKEKDLQSEIQQLMEHLSHAESGQPRAKLPNSDRSSKPRRKRSERPKILSEVEGKIFKCNKQANKMLSFEKKFQQYMDSCEEELIKKEHHTEQSKPDSQRNKNFVNSGSVPDGKKLKLCPVCRTFSSPSNTTLNAHIDHCLDAEPNIEKSVNKFIKYKAKVRKKRSMADICAVAPIRIVEDLEYGRRQHLAKDESPLKSDDFKWNDSNVRRKHRTPLSRLAKRQIDAEPEPRGKALCKSSIFTMDSLPDFHKERGTGKFVFDDKHNQSHRTRKNMQSVLSSLTAEGKVLNSHDFDKLDNKVSRTAVKHILNEDISQNASQESAMEDIPPSSINSASWACFNKHRSSRRKKLKHKLVSLNLAGFGQQSFHPGCGVLKNALETKPQNHLENSTMSEGTLVRPKETAVGYRSYSPGKGHNLSVLVSSKRNKEKQTRKGLENDCNLSAEDEELFSCKRTKNLSSFNFQTTTMHTLTKDQSSICEAKLLVSGKAQGDQDATLLNSSSSKEKPHNSHGSDKKYVNDIFNSQKPERTAVSKGLDYEIEASVHEAQSCQLQRTRSQEHFSQNKDLLNLNLKGPISFRPAAESSLKKSSLEHSNRKPKQIRHSKQKSGLPNMIKVAHIVHHSMDIKDAPEIDVKQTVHDIKFNSESPELTYDAGTTSSQAYGIKPSDCISTKAQLLCATETSSMDREHRSSPDLQLQAISEGELLRKPSETFPSIVHAEIAGETHPQIDSTVPPVFEASRTSFQGEEVATDENLQNYILKHTLAEMMGVASGGLEGCNNPHSCQQDALTQVKSKSVTESLSPDEGKDLSESCISIPNQLNSHSLGELEDIYLDDYVGKIADPQKKFDGESLCLMDESRGKLSSVCMETQPPTHKLATQKHISCHEFVNIVTGIVKPLNQSLRAVSSDSKSQMETAPTNISSVATKSFQGHSPVQQLKPHQAPALSNETIVLSSDSLRISSMSGDANFVDKPQILSELTSGNVEIPGLPNIDELSFTPIPDFGSLAGPAFDFSIQTSSSTITSMGLPSTSEAKALLLESSKYVDTNKTLPSVPMPDVVSDSLASAHSRGKCTAEKVLHGSLLNETPPKHPSIPDGVSQSSNNISAQCSEKRSVLKQNISSPPFAVTEGMMRSCARKNVCEFSPQLSSFSNNISTLLSHENGFHSLSKSNPKICGNQFSDSSGIYSLGSDTVTEPRYLSGRLSSVGNANCFHDTSIVHIFGNPILRLMGTNVILSSKDGTQ